MKKLELMPKGFYPDVEESDPLKLYYWPVFGKMYRRRVELCLNECLGGEKILEIGFGSGVSFLNLKDSYKEIHGIDLYSHTDEITEKFAEIGIETTLHQANANAIPYPDDAFDTVLLISILEHLKPEEQVPVFKEIKRVLKKGGQLVYGVPAEHPFMVFIFRALGYNIREHHFSTEVDVSKAAGEVFEEVRLVNMKSVMPVIKYVYQVGHFKNAG